jgi:HrpA-like RNA helicase
MERIDQSYGKDERGDLLIFVSGIQEISCLVEELQPYANYTKYDFYLKRRKDFIKSYIYIYIS